MVALGGRIGERTKMLPLRTALTFVLLIGAVTATIIASGDTGSQPAQADDTKTVNCAAPNNMGTNLVFGDGSNLFDMIAVIRCAINDDFGVITLEKLEKHTCYDKQDKTDMVVHGYNSSVVACGSGQIIVPAIAAHELYKMSSEMRWFVLAAAAGQNWSDDNNLSSQLCIGGYMVGSQPTLHATRLIADLRARQTSESDIETILVGISLALNYRSVADCTDPPRPWHMPNAEVVVPAAAGPGSKSPGASALPM